MLLKSKSPSYFTVSLYGMKSPSIQPKRPILRYSGISCAFNAIVSLRYRTRSFALSLVTSTPRSASWMILFLFITVPASTVTSRHRPSLKKASFTFSVSVSIFMYRSTGNIGCGQALVVTGIPCAVTSVIITPKSFAIHLPQLSVSGASVNAVLLLLPCFCNCVDLRIHAFNKLLNSRNRPTFWHFLRTASMNCAFSSTSVVSTIVKKSSSWKSSSQFIASIKFSFMLQLSFYPCQYLRAIYIDKPLHPFATEKSFKLSYLMLCIIIIRILLYPLVIILVVFCRLCHYRICQILIVPVHIFLPPPYYTCKTLPGSRRNNPKSIHTL